MGLKGLTEEGGAVPPNVERDFTTWNVASRTRCLLSKCIFQRNPRFSQFLCCSPNAQNVGMFGKRVVEDEISYHEVMLAASGSLIQ